MLESMACCGVYEMDGLCRSATRTLIDVCYERYDNGGDDFDDPKKSAFIIFTDVVRYGRGVRLAKYIKMNKFGKVYATKARTNPNTRCKIKVWVWSPNDKNLKKWWNKHK